jgi:hypothetical protein
LSTDAELKRSLETAGQTESKRFDLKVLVETIHGVYRDL